MRDRMLMQMDMDEHPDAKELFDTKVLRNLARPESAKDRQAIVDSMQFGAVEIEPNVYLYDTASFQFDLSRFSRVMKKMVRGLYAHHLGELMPDDYGLVTLPRADQESFQFMKSRIESSNPSAVFNPGGRFNVTYRFGTGSKHPLGNNWLFVFYRRYSFYVHAGPKGDTTPEVQQYDGMGATPFPVNLTFKFE
jgi:hypothetical protein